LRRVFGRQLSPCSANQSSRKRATAGVLVVSNCPSAAHGHELSKRLYRFRLGGCESGLLPAPAVVPAAEINPNFPAAIGPFANSTLAFPGRLAILLTLSFSEAKMELFGYIEVFYNQRRRHSTLGQISPAEFAKRTRA
jgi:hypothetical protein